MDSSYGQPLKVDMGFLCPVPLVIFWWEKIGTHSGKECDSRYIAVCNRRSGPSNPLRLRGGEGGAPRAPGEVGDGTLLPFRQSLE